MQVVSFEVDIIRICHETYVTQLPTFVEVYKLDFISLGSNTSAHQHKTELNKIKFWHVFSVSNVVKSTEWFLDMKHVDTWAGDSFHMHLLYI
jgi:hypothetical protein